MMLWFVLTPHGGPIGRPTQGGHLRNGGTCESGPTGGSTCGSQLDDGGFREGGRIGTAVGGTPRGESTHGGTNRGGVFRSDESIGSERYGQLPGNHNPVCHTTRPEMHASSDTHYNSSIDSGEAMRNRVLERTIR